MGFFETNPWALVPLIIVTVEAWNLTKAAVREALRRLTGSDASGSQVSSSASDRERSLATSALELLDPGVRSAVAADANSR